jgi:hypothetical protein
MGLDPVSWALIGSAAVAAAGAGASANQQHEAGIAAKTAANDQRAMTTQQRVQRDQNVQRIREVYGIGDTETAKGNSKTLADSIKRYYDANLEANTKQADDLYASTSRTSRQNLARVGQLGSGLDANSQTGNLSDYLRAWQNAISQAGSARDRLSGQLTNQRLSLESGVSGGSVANPDFGAYAANRDSLLSEAQKGVTPAAIGSGFNTAGSTYFTGKTQEAYGNQGMQAFGFGQSANRGKIT